MDTSRKNKRKRGDEECKKGNKYIRADGTIPAWASNTDYSSEDFTMEHSMLATVMLEGPTGDRIQLATGMRLVDTPHSTVSSRKNSELVLKIGEAVRQKFWERVNEDNHALIQQMAADAADVEKLIVEADQYSCDDQLRDFIVSSMKTKPKSEKAIKDVSIEQTETAVKNKLNFADNIDPPSYWQIKRYLNKFRRSAENEIYNFLTQSGNDKETPIWDSFMQTADSSFLPPGALDNRQCTDDKKYLFPRRPTLSEAVSTSLAQTKHLKKLSPKHPGRPEGIDDKEFYKGCKLLVHLVPETTNSEKRIERETHGLEGYKRFRAGKALNNKRKTPPKNYRHSVVCSKAGIFNSLPAYKKVYGLDVFKTLAPENSKSIDMRFSEIKLELPRITLAEKGRLAEMGEAHYIVQDRERMLKVIIKTHIKTSDSVTNVTEPVIKVDVATVEICAGVYTTSAHTGEEVRYETNSFPVILKNILPKNTKFVKVDLSLEKTIKNGPTLKTTDDFTTATTTDSEDASE